ncbi:hypothetical protein K491DRAFT_353305 [Lophiostoma macrostomum CBS 122681]|uniref:Zn(2)-C6 fungal-type domain-containing protein n=1 Tax=Lophiostoma macrostomum CBS 122681 TaxID=1314788 RepID=A0A6A6TA65_9PLEO|nr:hypothetical protein K491DRAFT_353305 [Lophiostoma macrostomum CBS 122681]
MIGLPHQPAASEPPSSSQHSIVTMDGREGRIGNAFACERCRKHKVRCVPSETAGICQRCQKARVECIEHVARRRPTKPRTVVQTPSRVAEMEKKLDKLSAIVTATPTPNPAHSASLPPVTTVPSQAAPERTHRNSTPGPVAPSPSVQAPPKPTFLPNPASTPESALTFWESINDTISGLGRLDPVIRSISVIHMQLLLESYWNMVDFFPFVSLPKETFCRDLLQQRPILMFSVLTAASYDSSLLQLTLSREFRKVVMVKIMNGEKSLDLLQGLLVFIAWHHHYMDTQAVSVHMLLQLCIGIAGDLGLDNIPASHATEDARNREAKRAYLGCYYLSSNIAILEPGRTRGLVYSRTLRNYASELSAAWEHKTDPVLPALIDTCQFMEDVEETFSARVGQALVAKSQVKRLNDRWESLRNASRNLPNDYSKCDAVLDGELLIVAETLHWMQMSARMHLYRSSASLEFPSQENPSWASGFQLSLRVTHLRSVEQFLDNGVLLNSSQYEFLSIVDWLNLISGLTALGKLALHSTALPGWDAADLQISRTFDHFRDRLSSQLPYPRDGQEHHEGVFERFRRVTAIMKMALKTVGGRGSPTGSTFEITSSSRQAVSILHDLPPLQPNGVANGNESLPAPWKVNPSFDMSSSSFHWKFLMGTV